MNEFEFESNVYGSLSRLETSSVEKLSFVSSVRKIQLDGSDAMEISMFKGSKMASTKSVVANQLYQLLALENPTVDLKFSEDLLDLEEDEDLINKSTIPLWVVDSQGNSNTIIVKRVF